MIFTPWALGLTICSIILLLLLFKIVLPSLIILFNYAKKDSSLLLSLEWQEMLSGAILRFAFLYFLFSPFLLTAAAFELGRQIPGAMCALGTFNANAYGFPLIIVRLIGVFIIASWLVLYSIDMNSPEQPFRNIRRRFIIFIFLFMLTDTVIQTLFFALLDSKIITSCCAIVFDRAGTFFDNPAGIFAEFPSCNLFFLVASFYVLSGFLSVILRNNTFWLFYGLFSPIFFFFSLFAVISCISPFIYAMPNHHCPFCILTGKEAFIGIPLLFSLYLSSIFSWNSGVAEMACKYKKASCSEIRRLRFIRSVAFILNLIFFLISGLAVSFYEF